MAARDPTPAAVGTFYRGQEVQQACETNNGHWACVTHEEAFGTQLEKDFHIARGDHVLVWICAEHGPETP